MGSRGINLLQWRDQRLSFIRASAYNSGRRTVKLSQVGQRFSIARIKADRPLEFSPGSLCKIECRDPCRIFGLLSQCPAQPEVIGSALVVEPHSLVAFIRRIVPAFKSEINPAPQIMRLRRSRQRTQQRERSVCFARLQSSIGHGNPVVLDLGQRKAGSQRQQSDCKHLPHGTLLIGTPSCRGNPVVVPVATQSPFFSPETMATCVRFSAPVTTKVFFNSSPSIL